MSERFLPPPPPPPSSRTVAVLFAIGVLIALAGLAGLSATAISHSAPTVDRADARPKLHPARIQEKYGYADSAGRMVIPARFDMADTFSEGLALVREGGRFGYIDVRGAFAIPAVFRHALPFRDGFASVRNGGEWILLDRTGRSVAARPARPSDTDPLAARDEFSR